MSLTFFIITIFLMITNLIWMIFFTPMVPNQEWAQKIFYLHVPIAWSGFLAYFFVMVSGICFLYTKNLKIDRNSSTGEWKGLIEKNLSSSS